MGECKREGKCSVIGLFNDVSKMWVLQIIWSIHIGKSSFNEIKKYLGGISSKTLSERLKELKESGFIERKIVSEQPIKIRYTLTEKGISFSEQTDKLNSWASKWGY